MLYKMTPPFYNGFIDEESMIKYADKLDEALNKIYFELNEVIKSIFGDKSYYYALTLEKEKIIKNEFYSCSTNINKLREFYNKYVSYMNLKFIDEVKENCCGYYIFRHMPIDKATTVNEILHAYHSYILNDENLIESVPIIDKRNINKYEEVVIRGKNVFNVKRKRTCIINRSNNK